MSSLSMSFPLQLSWEEWLALDELETDAWYRFRDLRDGKPCGETIAALADARDAILERRIFTRSLRVIR